MKTWINKTNMVMSVIGTSIIIYTGSAVKIYALPNSQNRPEDSEQDRKKVIKRTPTNDAIKITGQHDRLKNIMPKGKSELEKFKSELEDVLGEMILMALQQKEFEFKTQITFWGKSYEITMGKIGFLGKLFNNLKKDSLAKNQQVQVMITELNSRKVICRNIKFDGMEGFEEISANMLLHQLNGSRLSKEDILLELGRMEVSGVTKKLIIVETLFDKLLLPETSSEDRIAIGNKLGEIYSDHSKSQEIKELIQSKIKKLAHNACVIDGSVRFGLPKEIIEQMVPENSVVNFQCLEKIRNGQVFPLEDGWQKNFQGMLNLHGGEVKYQDLEIQFFRGEPNPDTGYDPVVLISVILPSGEYISELELEISDFRLKFDKSSFQEKIVGIEKLLSLLASRDFDSIFSNVSVLNDLGSFTTFGFPDWSADGMYLAMQIGNTNVSFLRRIKDELKRAIQKIIESSDSNRSQFSKPQQENIQKAWEVATGERLSFVDIVQKIKPGSDKDLQSVKFNATAEDDYSIL